jgi:hypothetical protein
MLNEIDKEKDKSYIIREDGKKLYTVQGDTARNSLY